MVDTIHNRISVNREEQRLSDLLDVQQVALLREGNVQ